MPVKEIIMKLAVHNLHHEYLHVHFSKRTRELLFAATCTLIPYAVAAIAVFVYHGQ